ncbi:hypothetical protein D1872_273610 [compost metagenome]
MDDLRMKFVDRIAVNQARQMDTFAKVGDVFQMVGPELVDKIKPYPLLRRAHLRLAFQNAEPLLV